MSFVIRQTTKLDSFGKIKIMTDFGELDLSKLKLAKNSPQQPDRRQTLQQRENAGSITPEEKAELMGLYAFPQNARGQELRKRDALGTITEDERRELAKLYQLKDFSPELIDLIRRNEEGDPNVLLVNMSDGKAIAVRDEDAEKVVFTFGLGGCTATLTYGELPDGTKIGIETHYPPTDMSGNLTKIKELSAQTGIQGAQKKTAIIISPGEYVQDKQSGEWRQEIKDKHILQVLTTAIQADMGVDTDIQVLPYSEARQTGRKDEGVALLRISPQSGVSYRTQDKTGTL